MKYCSFETVWVPNVASSSVYPLTVLSLHTTPMSQPLACCPDPHGHADKPFRHQQATNNQGNLLNLTTKPMKHEE